MSRWYLRCKHANCDFLFHASGERGLWHALKFIAHTCRVDPDCNAPHSLSSKVIGSFYAANQLEKSTAMTPTKIMQELKSNYDIHIRYNKAIVNPQSHVRLHTDHEHRFKYVFYVFHALINGFINYDSPVIVVDGTHLKGKYNEVVFVAVTQDYNHPVFPLATGISDVENNES
ncbi:hypothetical protein ACS0TY_030415 [Phlomoides rotata]